MDVVRLRWRWIPTPPAPTWQGREECLLSLCCCTPHQLRANPRPTKSRQAPGWPNVPPGRCRRRAVGLCPPWRWANKHAHPSALRLRPVTIMCLQLRLENLGLMPSSELWRWPLAPQVSPKHARWRGGGAGATIAPRFETFFIFFAILCLVVPDVKHRILPKEAASGTRGYRRWSIHGKGSYFRQDFVRWWGV